MVKRKRKNPEKIFEIDYYTTLLNDALIRGIKYDFSKALNYYKIGNWCNDCKEYSAFCTCESCIDCNCNYCVCEYSSKNQDNFRRKIWIQIRETLDKEHILEILFNSFSLNNYSDRFIKSEYLQEMKKIYLGWRKNDRQEGVEKMLKQIDQL